MEKLISASSYPSVLQAGKDRSTLEYIRNYNRKRFGGQFGAGIRSVEMSLVQKKVSLYVKVLPTRMLDFR